MRKAHNQAMQPFSRAARTAGKSMEGSGKHIVKKKAALLE